jgi:glycosyltransferase involved in cell wall biosynthesis
MSPRVSILIAARNNGRYLDETLQSAFAQTHAGEVIYADDASRDESLEIARRWEDRGLIVLPELVQRGVCATRNRAARVATGEYFVFLDGDDRLPRDFIARHLAAMTPETPFVYGPARAFGDGRHAHAYWSVPEWSDYDRWECNTVNTSAMYARWAFAAAGGWSDRVPTMWDWDLALRAARFGAPRVSTATLDYRQHDGSWSARLHEKDSSRGRFLAQVRRSNARLSVGSILSGRLPGLFSEWLDAVALSARRIPTSEPKSLILLDNSRDPEFQTLVDRELARHAETFGVRRVIPYPHSFTWQTETQRRDRVAEFLAQAYRTLAAAMPGDVQWFVEDDVFVPLDAGTLLWESLTDGLHPPHAISGCYRNRHSPGRYVGGWWRGDRPDEPHAIPRDKPGLIPVDFTGTGCLMTWPSRTPEWTDSHLRHIPAHDWAWSAQLIARRGKLYLHPHVRCDHAVSEAKRLPG